MSVSKRGLWLALVILAGTVTMVACQQAAPPAQPTAPAPKASEPAKAAAQADQKITIKLGHTQNPGTAIDAATIRMAEKAAELSNGSIEIQVFGAMSLGSEREQIEQVQTGSIDMGVFASDYLANIAPTVGVVSLPFVIRDLDHVHKVMDGPVGDELKAALLEKGKMRSVGTYDYSFRNTMTQAKALKSLPDFKGVKIRVMENPTVIKTWTLLGANPVPMPWNEVYSAMQTKVIDAMEAPPESMVSIKINEVGKYLTLTGHQFLVSHVVMREETWQKLSPEQQRVMEEVMADNQTFQRDFAERANEESLETMKAGGVEVLEIDKVPLQEAVKPVYDDFTQSANAGDLVQKVIAVK